MLDLRVLAYATFTLAVGACVAVGFGIYNSQAELDQLDEQVAAMDRGLGEALERKASELEKDATENLEAEYDKYVDRVSNDISKYITETQEKHRVALENMEAELKELEVVVRALRRQDSGELPRTAEGTTNPDGE